MTDSITLTGANAEPVDGAVGDQVRVTITGKIVHQSIHEPVPFNPVIGSISKKPKGKTEREVRLDVVDVEDCESMGDETAASDEGAADESGMPEAIGMIAGKVK
jgi:hypothetical protein